METYRCGVDREQDEREWTEMVMKKKKWEAVRTVMGMNVKEDRKRSG